MKNVALVLKPSLALAGLGALAVVAWQVALHAPDGRLHLTVLDVGRGDAPHPDSFRSFRAGGRRRQPGAVLARIRPAPAAGAVEAGMAGGGFPWYDQVQALPRVLERFPPQAVLWAGEFAATRAARNLHEYLTENGIEPETAMTGQALDLGDGAVLRVLYAGDGGAVLLLEWHNFRAPLPVGMDEAALYTMLDDPALTPVTALLLAQGGDAELNPPEWIKKLRPQVALLSIAAGDQPDPEVVEALAGYTLQRTDKNGWIEITTDGEQMWVGVERK